MATAAALSLVHEEMLRKTAVDAVKREADNEKYARQVRDLMHVVADDVRRSVARSEAAKAMDDEQAARVHAVYFKSCIANRINRCTPMESDDPMLNVREQLLRDVAQKQALLAEENEQLRRIVEEMKHTIADDVRRAVARKSVDGAAELEQAQRITIENLHEISGEIRRTVSANEANAAMDTEQMQRMQADHFKRFIAGHIGTNQQKEHSNAMAAVQAELLQGVSH